MFKIGSDLCWEADEQVTRHALLHAKVADQVHRNFCPGASLYCREEVLEADACVQSRAAKPSHAHTHAQAYHLSVFLCGHEALVLVLKPDKTRCLSSGGIRAVQLHRK